MRWADDGAVDGPSVVGVRVLALTGRALSTWVLPLGVFVAGLLARNKALVMYLACASLGVPGLLTSRHPAHHFAVCCWCQIQFGEGLLVGQ